MTTPRRIAITGSHGLIGSHLLEALRAEGHTVHRMVRSRAHATAGDIYWNVEANDVDTDALEGVDAVVHLAGEPLGERRWTAATKRRIEASRTKGTRLLADALAGLDQPPSVLLSGSAVGYYGSRGDDLLDEDADPGDDFLARVTRAWEAAADPARAAGIRVAHPRTGVVIAAEGPLIEKVEWPFRLGIGGRVGSGRQWYPWIALEDQIRALRFLLDRDDLAGPFNLTAPDPATNAELTRALGEVLHRPTVLPIPVFAVSLLYGEMGRTLATASQRAVPRRLLEAGFSFEVTDLREALRRALRR